MIDNTKAMDLAYEAGEILLENGAEIMRVEDTMTRIATHFGVQDSSFFVLSNGITATSQGYAKTKFIPIKGANLEKVVDVNQVSRDLATNKYTPEELENQLVSIQKKKSKPFIEQVLGSAFGSAAFCIIFGGGLIDSLAAFVAGFILWIFMYFIGFRHLSRILGNVAGGLLGTALCLLMYKMGFGENLSNMIIGAIIPLIPGVPFTNGIRDLANEDYIAGVTRLLDALLIFFCISVGVALAFVIDSHIFNGMQEIGSLYVDPITSNFAVQIMAAMIGTVAFAILFGVPRRYYLFSGICGTIGWLFYILMRQYTGMSVVEMVVISTVVITLTSLFFSIKCKCPITVFLICGIFPLVPGEGIFRTTYNIVTKQLYAALQSGFVALEVTVAIAFGILIITEIKKKISK